MDIEKVGYLPESKDSFPFRQFIQPQAKVTESNHEFLADAVFGQNDTDYNIGVGQWKRGRVSRNPPMKMQGDRPPATAKQGIQNVIKAPYNGAKKPSLVLFFERVQIKEFAPQTGRIFIKTVYKCRLGKWISIRLSNNYKGSWIATAMIKKKLLFQTRGGDHKMALARLCGQEWFYYSTAAEWWSLYDVYKSISWQGLDVRENAIPKFHVRELDANHIRGVWCFLADHTKRPAQGLKKVKLKDAVYHKVNDVRNELSFVPMDGVSESQYAKPEYFVPGYYGPIQEPVSKYKPKMVTKDVVHVEYDKNGKEISREVIDTVTLIAAPEQKYAKPKFVAGVKVAPATAPASIELEQWSGVISPHKIDDSKSIQFKELPPMQGAELPGVFKRSK